MHLFSQIFEWNREVNFHQQQMTRANASCKAKTKQNCSTGHLYDAHDSIWMLFHAQNNNMHNTHLHNVQCSMFNLSFYWFHTRRWYRCHNRSQRLTFYYRHCSGDILFSIQWKKGSFSKPSERWACTNFATNRTVFKVAWISFVVVFVTLRKEAGWRISLTSVDFLLTRSIHTHFSTDVVWKFARKIFGLVGSLIVLVCKFCQQIKRTATIHAPNFFFLLLITANSYHTYHTMHRRALTRSHSHRNFSFRVYEFLPVRSTFKGAHFNYSHVQ